MHCYEVIPEGAVCKLYFDLEFDVASNAHLDGPKMVASLIQVKTYYVCKKKNPAGLYVHRQVRTPGLSVNASVERLNSTVQYCLRNMEINVTGYFILNTLTAARL